MGVGPTSRNKTTCVVVWALDPACQVNYWQHAAEKITRNRLATVSVILRKKVLIPRRRLSWHYFCNFRNQNWEHVFFREILFRKFASIFCSTVENSKHFSLPWNVLVRNSVGTNHLFRLFCLPRNYFFVGKAPRWGPGIALDIVPYSNIHTLIKLHDQKHLGIFFITEETNHPTKLKQEKHCLNLLGYNVHGTFSESI